MRCWRCCAAKADSAIAVAVAVAVAVILLLPWLLTTGSPSAATEPAGKNPEGDAHGRASFFYATGMSRRKIPPAEWTRRAQRGGRVGRGVFLWATFLCTSKERWLAPRRGAKAFDSVSALALASPKWLCQSDRQRAKAETKHESRRLKAELSPLLRRSELLLFARAKRSNQEKARPAYAPTALRAAGPLRRWDFSTRHPCLVEKRRASMRVALRVFSRRLRRCGRGPGSQKPGQKQNHRNRNRNRNRGQAPWTPSISTRRSRRHTSACSTMYATSGGRCRASACRIAGISAASRT